jgi:hypothetical protein
MRFKIDRSETRRIVLKFNAPLKPYSRTKVQSFRENHAGESNSSATLSNRSQEVSFPNPQISPLSVAGFDGREPGAVRPWRRESDSKPRYGCPHLYVRTTIAGTRLRRSWNLARQHARRQPLAAAQKNAMPGHTRRLNEIWVQACRRLQRIRARLLH